MKEQPVDYMKDILNIWKKYENRLPELQKKVLNIGNIQFYLKLSKKKPFSLLDLIPHSEKALLYLKQRNLFVFIH